MKLHIDTGFLKNILIVLLILDVLLLGVLFLHYYFDHKQMAKDWARKDSEIARHRSRTDSLDSISDSLFYASERLRVELEVSKETGCYLVVDTESKSFQLRKGNMIIREGPCGVGKGFTERGSRNWNFETPKGDRNIVSKTENPEWHRPSWHWFEQGKSVPDDFITFSPNMPDNERREAFRIMSSREKNLVRSVPGALGRYSLGLGDGYFIHYGSGLGRALSHGCIRVGADDLDAIYRVLEIGDPVFIY